MSSTGLVTGVSAGDAVITVTRGGLTASQIAHVRDWTLETVTAAASGGTHLLYETASKVRVTGHFSGDHTQDMTSLFALSVAGASAEVAEPIITVKDENVTAGKKVGTATVDATGQAMSIVDGQTLHLDFDVVDPASLTALAISAPETLSTKGKMGCITVTGSYGEDAVEIETSAATLTADPDGIVYVDQANGTVTGLTAGSVTLTASFKLNADDADESNDKIIDTSHEITVVNSDVTELLVAPASDDDKASVPVGASTQLSAAASFGDSDTEDATDLALWTSDNESVAVVSNVVAGRVTGLAAGKATIKASYRGTSATFAVTVEP